MKTIAPLAPLLLPLFSSLAAFITTAEARVEVEVEDIENVELLEMADYIKNVSGMELDPTSLISMLSSGTRFIEEVEPDSDKFYAILSAGFDEILKPIPPKDAVDRVRRGMGLTTNIVHYISNSANQMHQRYFQDMVDAGLVSVILDLVNQCNQTIVDVVETEGHILPYKKNRFHKTLGGVEEGYLDDPVPWFDILFMVLLRAEMRGVGKKKLYYIKR